MENPALHFPKSLQCQDLLQELFQPSCSPALWCFAPELPQQGSAQLLSHQVSSGLALEAFPDPRPCRGFGEKLSSVKSTLVLGLEAGRFILWMLWRCDLLFYHSIPPARDI